MVHSVAHAQKKLSVLLNRGGGPSEMILSLSLSLCSVSVSALSLSLLSLSHATSKPSLNSLNFKRKTISTVIASWSSDHCSSCSFSSQAPHRSRPSISLLPSSPPPPRTSTSQSHPRPHPFGWVSSAPPSDDHLPPRPRECLCSWRARRHGDPSPPSHYRSV